MSIVPNVTKKESLRYEEEIPEQLNLLKKVLSLKIKNFDDNYQRKEYFKKENVLSTYQQLLKNLKDGALKVIHAQIRSMKITGVFLSVIWIALMSLCWKLNTEWTALFSTSFVMFFISMLIFVAIESSNNEDLYNRGVKRQIDGYIYYINKIGVKGMSSLWIAFHNLDLKDEKEKLEWLEKECERLGVNGEVLMVEGEKIEEEIESFIRKENLKIYEKKYEEVK